MRHYIPTIRFLLDEVVGWKTVRVETAGYSKYDVIERHRLTGEIRCRRVTSDGTRQWVEERND